MSTQSWGEQTYRFPYLADEAFSQGSLQSVVTKDELIRNATLSEVRHCGVVLNPKYETTFGNGHQI